MDCQFIKLLWIWAKLVSNRRNKYWAWNLNSILKCSLETQHFNYEMLKILHSWHIKSKGTVCTQSTILSSQIGSNLSVYLKHDY